MTWGEFKALVEKGGIQDSDEINYIDVSGSTPWNHIEVDRHVEPEDEDGPEYAHFSVA